MEASISMNENINGITKDNKFCSSDSNNSKDENINKRLNDNSVFTAIIESPSDFNEVYSRFVSVIFLFVIYCYKYREKVFVEK